VMMALMVTGISYGMWSKTLYINGTVETGKVDAELHAIESNDDGFGAVTETEDPSECGTWTWKGWDTKWEWSGSRYNKNVGECTISAEGGVQELTVTLTNAYPYYCPSVAYVIKNTGSIPVKIESIKLIKVSKNGAEWTVDFELTACEWCCIDFDGTPHIDTSPDPTDELAIHVSNIYVGDQIEPAGQPGDTLPGDLCILVLQAAEQNTSYDFTIKIVVAQWNEV